jgi:ABC transporter substrate binding protein
VLAARTAREIDEAFASLTRQGAAALLVAPDTYFIDRHVQLATLATRYMLPTIGTNRDYAEAGGLMSYGSNIVDQFRQAGIYVGRILKGERAADLPVIRQTRFELVIKAQTARILGIEVPPSLLAIADEVIELVCNPCGRLLQCMSLECARSRHSARLLSSIFASVGKQGSTEDSRGSIRWKGGVETCPMRPAPRLKIRSYCDGRHMDMVIVITSNQCPRSSLLLMRSFVGSCHVIVGELDEVPFHFGIGRAPREIEGGHGLTAVVIGTRHLEHLFWFAPSRRLKLVPLPNGCG